MTDARRGSVLAFCLVVFGLSVPLRVIGAITGAQQRRIARRGSDR